MNFHCLWNLLFSCAWSYLTLIVPFFIVLWHFCQNELCYGLALFVLFFPHINAPFVFLPTFFSLSFIFPHLSVHLICGLPIGHLSDIFIFDNLKGLLFILFIFSTCPYHCIFNLTNFSYSVSSFKSYLVSWF
jgi:hypothetical protein